MDINFGEGWLPNKDIMKKMDEAARYILHCEGIEPELIEVSVIFVDPEEIKDLNRLHRNIDEVTDVLSFPQYEDSQAIIREIVNETTQNKPEKITHEDLHITLGDVVICKEKIEEQAEYYFHSFERELLYLFTHSILHLLNYDHEKKEDYIKMREMESRVMDEIGVGRK